MEHSPLTRINILEATARISGVSIEKIHSRKNAAAIVDARYVAVILMRDLIGSSFRKIGLSLHHDHSTLVKMLPKQIERLKTNSEFAHLFVATMRDIAERRARETGTNWLHFLRSVYAEKP